MSHQAIYRRYRPKTFDEVIGQRHITETLKNQIIRKTTAHAYLFSGIRGTGKTSTAKIFARAINCLDNQSGNPCNQCESCLSILADRNMDVIEMDAASNNSVEDIRDLREKVRFLPSQSKFKVYIIDEVHMLSKGAFNALLKTLEEPPEHLLFLLATTEPQKIPATILSRCQRFDLRRIPVSDMLSVMEKILEDLSITADPEALRMIANNGEGAMRDALSILDRCLVFSQEHITYEGVLELLGTVNYQIVLKFTEGLINKNIGDSLWMLDQILSEGKEITRFLEDLIIHMRHLLIAKSVSEKEKFIYLGEDALLEITRQSEKVTIPEIIHMIEALSETLMLCKRSINERVLLETRIIKLLNMGSAKIESPSIQTKPKEEIATIPKESSNDLNDEINQPDGKEEFALKEIKKQWEDILASIKSRKISLNAIIKECEPVEVSKGTLTLAFDEKYTFHYQKANTKESKQIIEEVLKQTFNKKIPVQITIKKNEFSQKKEMTQEELILQTNQKAIELLGEDNLKIID